MEAVSVRPSVEFERAFLAMLDDFELNDPENAAFYVTCPPPAIPR
jgi:hypothetical protein